MSSKTETESPRPVKTRTRLNLRRHAAVLTCLIASAVLVALGVVQFHDATAAYRPVVPPYDLFWCREDADCAVVDRIGCCACSSGGAQAAVTKWHRDDLREFLRGACQPKSVQVCVQVGLCRDDVEARCIERRCKLVFAKDD